jgi:cysteine desulfurase/selenocysteine lyase
VNDDAFNIAEIRANFPGLAQEVHGHPLVYLDNAATGQTSQPVLEALEGAYQIHRANVHRGVHHLSQIATDRYEAAREEVRAFIGAAQSHEVLFTRGTTEAINLVAGSWGSAHLQPGDEIVVTELEHHSNIVPWQLIAARTGAMVRPVPIRDDGQVPIEHFEAVINDRTRMVAMAHVSNTLGTVLPVAQVAELAHAHRAVLLVDGAQAVPHMAVDVQTLGCDFYAFSGHKLYGPTGIGALWGHERLLNAMPPWQGGGAMIEQVSFEGTTFNTLPDKFEAGTPHIAGAIGLGAACAYLQNLGMARIAQREDEILKYAEAQLGTIDAVTIYGQVPHKAAVISFNLDGAHASDVGTILDRQGIAIRTGHHCTQPLMKRLGVSATARASFAFYNTLEEVDRFIEGVRTVRELFA